MKKTNLLIKSLIIGFSALLMCSFIAYRAGFFRPKQVKTDNTLNLSPKKVAIESFYMSDEELISGSKSGKVFENKDFTQKNDANLFYNDSTLKQALLRAYSSKSASILNAKDIPVMVYDSIIGRTVWQIPASRFKTLPPKSSEVLTKDKENH